jgi:hypothetical protein
MEEWARWVFGLASASDDLLVLLVLLFPALLILIQSVTG